VAWIARQHAGKRANKRKVGLPSYRDGGTPGFKNSISILKFNFKTQYQYQIFRLYLIFDIDIDFCHCHCHWYCNCHWILFFAIAIV